MIQKIVLDTNVVVEGLRSRGGASHKILRWIATGRFDLLMSVPLFFEYQAVLSRPEQLREMAPLKRPDVDLMLGYWAQHCLPVKFHYLWRPQLKDPGDEMVLETAVNGACDYLVTFNLRDFAMAGRLFDLKVVAPAELLELLKGKSDE